MSQEKPATPAVRTEADRPRRTTRIPFGGARTKLAIGFEIPGQHLHWINDTAGRLDEAQQGGYSFVSPSEVGFTEKESQVKRFVGKDEAGEAIHAYLMKIDIDLYEEDQRTLQAGVDVFDRAMKAGILDQKVGDMRYNAGIKITTETV